MGRLFRTTFLVLAAIAQAAAQDVATAEQQAETLRAQLRDVIDKQAQLQARAQQLDEALKPENIERSVAGIGTTDATALRDRRRQQLEREKAGVEEQLQSLATSRSRLEASIASAEAEAVRLRAAALGANNAPPRTGAAAASASTAPAARGKQNTRRARRRTKRAGAHRRAPSH
jgi:ABC-type phosphate transport system auxiliary subunit